MHGALGLVATIDAVLIIGLLGGIVRVLLGEALGVDDIAVHADDAGDDASAG